MGADPGRWGCVALMAFDTRSRFPAEQPDRTAGSLPMDRTSLTALGPPALSVTAAAVWGALALSNPTLTYHFAPLVVAAGWPVAERTARGRVEARRTRTPVAGSLLLTVLVSLALWLGDAMRGPTFWTETGAIWEAVAFAALGSAWGFRVLTRARGGLFSGEPD